jgi:murein DD-endopeptidase MepM/ murein hydrolase activator NlpD
MRRRERHLSIIIAPHHKGGQHVFDVSYSTLRWLGVLAAAAALFIAGLVVNYGHIYWRAGQYELMKKRQDEMEAEFAKLGALKAEIGRISAIEGKVRGMLQTGKQPDTLSVTQISTAPPAAAAALPAAVAPPRSDSTSAGPPSLKPARGWVSAGVSGEHHGVDIAAREGEPVMAAADGIVSFAGWDSYFGNKIEIAHGTKYATMYGHSGKLLVKAGDRVKRGQIIALVGSTGTSSGPHLHYELFIDGKPADPANYWINR